MKSFFIVFVNFLFKQMLEKSIEAKGTLVKLGIFKDINIKVDTYRCKLMLLLQLFPVVTRNSPSSLKPQTCINII